MKRFNVVALVILVFSVEGGGHSWPGSPTMLRRVMTQDVNATDVIWDFFQAHPRP